MGQTKRGNLSMKDEAWISHHSVHGCLVKTARQHSAGHQQQCHVLSVLTGSVRLED